MKPARSLSVAIVAALTIATLIGQALLLRPYLYPAGAGLTLSGDAIMNELAEPPPVGFAHLPNVATVMGRPITITNVWPGSPADRAGLSVGTIVTASRMGGSKGRMGRDTPEQRSRRVARVGPGLPNVSQGARSRSP